MQPVFGLVEDSRLRSLEDLVGHLANLGVSLCNLGFEVVKSWQAVEKDRVRAPRGSHQLPGYLVWAEKPDTLLDQVFLPHRDPHVGVDGVCACEPVLYGICDRHRATGGGRELGHRRHLVSLGL